VAGRGRQREEVVGRTKKMREEGKAAVGGALSAPVRGLADGGGGIQAGASSASGSWIGADRVGGRDKVEGKNISREM
jgi:hypothetical protein